MERKTINISSKRQVTIPQKYFDILGFGTEAECVLQNGALLIRPIRNSGGEFAEQILAGLIAQGYTGEEPLSRFKAEQAKVRPAVEELLSAADTVAAAAAGTAAVPLGNAAEASGSRRFRRDSSLGRSVRHGGLRHV